MHKKIQYIIQNHYYDQPFTIKSLKITKDEMESVVDDYIYYNNAAV